MDADQGYANYSQAYEYETGMTPSYEQYQKYAESEQFNPAEIEEAQVEYAQTVGDLSNFMNEKGITFDDVLNQLPEETDDRTIQMLLDPQKIESYDDVVSVGMAVDTLADILNLDTDKFFTTGEIEECGEECQQRRSENNG